MNAIKIEINGKQPTYAVERYADQNNTFSISVSKLVMSERCLSKNVTMTTRRHD